MELLWGKSSPRNYRALRLQNKLHPAAVATAAGPSEKALGHATQGIEMPKPWQGIFRPIFSTNRFVSNIVQYGNMVVSSKGDTPKSSILVRFSTINQPFCPPHLWNPPYGPS